MSFSFKKCCGKLIFTDFGGYETRNHSTIWCIQQADDIYKWSDFEDIKIHTHSKQNGYNNLVPDFNFHSWPQVGINDYESFSQQIHIVGLLPAINNKVGWIGNSDTNVMRKKLLQLGDSNKELFDFYDMRWTQGDNIHLNSNIYISTPDLVSQYSMLIDIEGNGYSGRLKHLIWSHRPLLLVDRPHKEYFFEHLKEWEHYIPVKRDLSDLVEKTQWCINNYKQALHIAENAYEFSKQHLTRIACYKKWNEIITSQESYVVSGKVCYIVLTCEKYIPTRVKWQTETFLKKVDSKDVYFLSCKNEGSNIYGWNTPDDYASCPLKYVSFLRNMTIHYDWYCFIDDDTFINVDNLHNLLNTYNKKESLYIGHICDNYSPPFYMSGGAGFLLTKSTYFSLLEYIRTTSNDKLLISIYGDLSIGCWLKNVANVALIDNKLFHAAKHNNEEELEFFASVHNLTTQEDFEFYNNCVNNRQLE